jgi:hypothetical protein
MRKRVVTIGLPAPMMLMEPLLHATGKWHDSHCERPGCELVCAGDEAGNWELQHRWAVPAVASGSDAGAQRVPAGPYCLIEQP